jgi:hypothetical protein
MDPAGPFTALAAVAARRDHGRRSRLLDADPRLLTGDPAYWTSDFGFALAGTVDPRIDAEKPTGGRLRIGRINPLDLTIRASGVLYRPTGDGWVATVLDPAGFDRLLGLHLIRPPDLAGPFRLLLLRRRTGRVTLPVPTTADAVRTGSQRLVFAAEVHPRPGRSSRTPPHWSGEYVERGAGPGRLRGRTWGAVTCPASDDDRTTRGYLSAEFVALALNSSEPRALPPDDHRRLQERTRDDRRPDPGAGCRRT